MITSGVYLFNVFCAMVPCSVTQPPPQAFIGDSITDYNNVPSSTPRYILPTQISSSSSNQRLNFTFDEEAVKNLGPRTKRLHLHPQQPRGARTSDTPRRTRMTIPIQSSSTHQNQQSSNIKNHPIVSNIFSAVPVIPVLLNNFNNFMKSMTTAESSSKDGIQRPNRDSGAPAPRVITGLGEIEGYYMGTMKGRRIAAFEGIPYAEPPVGKYRFRAPTPKFPWKRRILHVKKTGSQCLQPHPLDFFRVTGSEDCLFLNVYTPNVSIISRNASELLPVLFLIHGGSFQYGASGEYGPSYILDENVILVTVNYRLGPLGFLSTGDEEASGNWGLKDQALALQWVHDNIEVFGGDNEKITLLGQSAGAVSAHLHLISNVTTSLFRSGVSLSGSAFGFWPIIARPRAKELTTKLAGVLGCNGRNSKEMISCLRWKNANMVTAAQMQLYEWIPFHPLVLFGPVIENEGPSSFLTKMPEDCYKNEEVPPKPWIFGQTSQEGHFDIYFMRLLMQAAPIALNGRKYLPLILGYSRNNPRRKQDEITNKILKFYGGAMLGRGINMNSISDMYTDRFYTHTIRKALKAHSKIAPDSTFAYVFDFKGKYNLGSLFGAQESEWGVSHTEDMFYYFNSSVYHHGLQRDDGEYALSQIMTDFLANFVSTSSPTHNSGMAFWDPVKGQGVSQGQEPLEYLQIRKDIGMINDPFTKRVQFWDQLEKDGLIKN